MKSRQGFVSNSSSSSFILSGKKTVIEYARQMVPFRDWEERDNELDNMLKQLQDDPSWNDNAPITFNTCNYETYIARLGDHVYIATCNNHPFYEAFDDDCASPDCDTRVRELNILMTTEDADYAAEEIYDGLWFEDYKQWFTEVSEDYLNEAKFDIASNPKRIHENSEFKLVEPNYWSYKINKNTTIEQLLECFRIAELEFRFTDERICLMNPEFAKLFKKITNETGDVGE